MSAEGDNPAIPEPPPASPEGTSGLDQLPEEFLNAVRSGDTRLVMRMAASLQATTGILPPPAMLREYEQILPGMTERFFGMLERQEAHRQRLESTTVEGNEKRSWWGMRFAFVLSVVLILGALGLGFDGKQATAITLGSIDVVGLAGVFVYGRVEQRAERREKAEQMRLPPEKSQ